MTKDHRLMDKYSRIWLSATKYCVGRPLAMLGYTIGIVLFFLIWSPGNSAISENASPVSKTPAQVVVQMIEQKE